MNRSLRRVLAGPASAVVLAGLAAVLPVSPAHAAQNTLTFGADGSDHGSYAGNGMVIVDGSITYENNCRAYAVRNSYADDWIYPATDVYIIPTGSARYGQELRDAGGDGPNTIVGTTSGAFIGELIAVTTPTGTLGDGDFDVVFDTCQDGMIDAADEIFTDVINVDVLDGAVPPVDPSIRRLKDAAREEYASWLRTHVALTMLFKLDDAKAVAGCFLAPNPACLLEVLAVIQDVDHSRAPFEDWIEGIVLGEVVNTAKKWGAIWKDPADPKFELLPKVQLPQQRDLPASGQPVADALAGLAEPLRREAVLAEELLHALERYQGAQEAGDGSWALVQARAVSDVADALAEQMAESDAVESMHATLTDRLPSIVASAEEGEDAAERLRREGLTADEQRRLTNAGFAKAEIAAMERSFVEQGALVAPTQGDLRASLDALLTARREMRDALAETVAAWSEHAEKLEQTVTDLNPVADAGGPYETDAEGGVHLTAAASAAGRDGAKLTGAEWDLDGDGAFDDANGFEVDVTVGTTRTVAVRVSDGDGRRAVDLAQVTRAAGDRAPVLGTTSPANAVTVVTGEHETFSAPASDPDGDDLGWTWTFRGEPVTGADGPTLRLDATEDMVGVGTLAVHVKGARRSAAHSWLVTVVGPDTDGDGWSDGPDCDDSRTDIHPKGYERVGNGLDDDCDASTPDAPVGGLLGSVLGWGHSSGLGLPQGGAEQPRTKPVPVPALQDNVQHVESTFRGGFAVTSGGAAYGWGENFNGRVGDGSHTRRWAPVPVLGVGGGAGTQLTGVAEISSDGNHVLSRLGTGGNVVAWGMNSHGELGSGDSVAERVHPVHVVDETGSSLTGAVQVETGEHTSFAVMRNGTVRNWGVVACDDDFDTTESDVAVTNTLLGGSVVQVASGDGGGVFVRRADGSVWSCGGYDDALGRPYTNGDVAELHPVVGLDGGIVDISMGSGVGAAVDEDGRLWMWGRNNHHELDVLGLQFGATQKHPAAVPLPDGPPVVDVEVDFAGTVLVTRADGAVLSWGANTYGAAGVGTSTHVVVPPVPQVDLGGHVPLSVRGSDWNGLALVRPVDDPEFEPALQWVSAEIGDAEIGEGAGGHAKLTLSEAAPADLTARYRLGSGEVREVVVPAGSTVVPLPLAVEDDQLDEADEPLALTLLSVSRGVRLTRETAVVTVLDDDAAPTVSAGSLTVDEGDTSLNDVSVPVTLDARSGKDVEVLWTARVAGSSDELASGHVLVPAGVRSVDVHLPLVGDTRPDQGSRVTVVLRDPVNARLGSDGTVTVRDDDPVKLEVTAPEVTETDEGTTPAEFTLTVTGIPAGETVEVPWTVEQGTAEIGSDVAQAEGTVRLDADQSTAQAVVPVLGDLVAEPVRVEVFGLTLGRGLRTSTGRPVLVTGSPEAQVADDDEGPFVDAGQPVRLDEGQTVPITGQASAPATWSVVGAGCTVAAPAALSTTLTCTQDGEAELTLTADDGVNEPVSATVAVTVLDVPVQQFPFDGFFAPVDNPATLNIVKGGSTVPVKFSLGGDRGMDIFAPGYPASSQHSCSGTSTDSLEQTSSPGAATLTYDAASGRYHYNWKTQKSWAGTCRTLVVKLVDGRTKTAEFKFK